MDKEETTFAEIEAMYELWLQDKDNRDFPNFVLENPDYKITNETCNIYLVYYWKFIQENLTPKG